MTIAGFSAIAAEPVFDEGRRFYAEQSLSGVVCRMECNMAPDAAAAAAQQSALPSSKNPSPVISIPAPSSLPSSDGSSPRLAFVYGTLKQGFGNHWLMEELLTASHARFLGFACTKRRFPLVCGPFQVPFLLPSPSPAGHHVRGELYQVDSLAISRLDDLEGVSKGHYERRPIDIFLLPQSPDADALAHLERGTHTQQQSNMQAHLNEMNTHQSNGNTDPLRPDLDTSSCYNLAGPSTSCRLYMDPSYLDEMDTSLSTTQSSGPSGYLRAEAYFACPSYGLQMADCAPHIPCYTEKEASTYVRRKDRPNGRTFLEHIHAWIEENGLVYT